MQAGNDHAVCAVKAAGNANDHRRTTAERPLVDAVVASQIRRIDLLRLTVGDGNDARTRYAHSYIGIGLTPVVAIDLEKGGKGSFKEIVSVVRTFARFRAFTSQLESGGRRGEWAERDLAWACLHPKAGALASWGESAARTPRAGDRTKVQ